MFKERHAPPFTRPHHQKSLLDLKIGLDCSNSASDCTVNVFEDLYSGFFVGSKRLTRHS